jgi:O-antigen ligase/polysaccharide polymerase Wzy-like membrane protein
MLNIKQVVLLVFIISQIPGDNFYGNLGIAQSYFVLPLLGIYFLNNSLVPKIKMLNVSGIAILAILTIQLILFKFSGLIEWYRTVGGVVLTMVLTALYWDGKENRNQLKWIVYATAVPVAAFYLGLWTIGGAGNPRSSFLQHDPNHLAQLLLYGVIGLLYLLQSVENSKNRRYFVILLILWFFPIAYTVSRTAIIIYFLIVILYVMMFYKKTRLVNFGFMIFIILFIISLSPVGLGKITDIKIIGFYEERFSEKSESRLNYYSHGFKLVRENFFTGVGISNFQDHDWRVRNGFYRNVLLKNRTMSVSTSSHNGFLDIMLIGGIFLFLAFCTIIFYPAYFIYNYSRKYVDPDMKIVKFIIYSLTIVFVTINMTYSLYNSKLGWWGIGLSYLLISKYYLRLKYKSRKLIKLT